jgi:hypothetical protein
MREVRGTIDHERLLTAILSELAQRHAVTPAGLRRLTGLGDRVDEAFADLVRTGAVVVNGEGAIVAAYPLSAVPTGHVVELGALAPWANCAIDALAVPMMVGRRGTVRSACAHCGSPVVVEVDGSTIRAAHPAEAVVAHGRLTDCGDRPSLEVSCPFINFFCGREHAEAWQRPKSWQGRIIPLHEAAALAVDRFQPIIQIYQRHLPTRDVLGQG